MGNLKTVSQPLLDCLHDPCGLLNGRVPCNGEMAGENDEAGCDRPHVQVMDAADGGDRPNRLRDLLRPKVRGSALRR